MDLRKMPNRPKYQIILAICEGDCRYWSAVKDIFAFPTLGTKRANRAFLGGRRYPKKPTFDFMDRL